MRVRYIDSFRALPLPLFAAILNALKIEGERNLSYPGIEEDADFFVAFLPYGRPMQCHPTAARFTVGTSERHDVLTSHRDSYLTQVWPGYHSHPHVDVARANSRLPNDEVWPFVVISGFGYLTGLGDH